MAISSDEHDLLDVFLIINLPNIANNNFFVSAPLGFQQFVDTVVVDNVSALNFPSDIRELLVNYILTRQVPDQRGLLRRRPILEQSVF